LFQAGTRQEGDKLVTAGGRVLVLTAFGNSPEEARAKAMANVLRIQFEGKYFRRDIGEDLQELDRLTVSA
jgi:phosphoribosylamine--glycine ligase